MGVRRMVLAAPCPGCAQPNLQYVAADLDIPYFGPVVETLILCGACGFKHADVVIGRARQPARSTFRVAAAEHMLVRVVRSTSGTVRIPELGVRVDPGPASEAYVSNVEGVLVRVERVLNQLLRDAEDEEAAARCRQRLGQIEDVKAGRWAVTLILEDPLGNSAIAHPEATIELIPEEEAQQLARGEFTIDVEDLANGDGDGTSPLGAA